jgi:hypothetical protein
MIKTASKLTATFAVLLLSAASASAIDIAPGGYTSLPGGIDLALLYTQYSNSNKLYVDGVGKVPASNLEVAFALGRYLHYFEVGGVRFAVDAFLPVGSLNSQIGGVNQRIKDGIGDLSVGGILWLTHSSSPTGTTVAMSTYFTMPTGAFSATAISLGSGAFTVTPQLAAIQGLGNGFFFDGAVDVGFQADHSDSGLNLSRDPSAQLQTYLRYQFSPETSVAFGYSGTFGGKSFVDGQYTGIKTRNDELRVFASTFLTKTFQVQAMIGADINTEGGFRRDVYGQLRFMKVF